MTTANKITKVPDRVDRAKALLLAQFKDKININKIVEALLEEVQELDDAVVDVQELRTLNNAKGEQLTEIGRKLKVYRDNLGDEDFRTAIKVKILRSKSSGTENDISEVIRLLLSDPSATITQPHPYTVEIAAYLGCLGDTEAGVRQLAQFLPLNTNVRILAKRNPVFAFEGQAGLGFSSYGGSSGGQIASLVYNDYGISQRKGFSTRTTVLPPVITNTLPLLIAVPQVTGSVIQGSLLSTTNGEWSSDTPLTYTYQWLRDGVVINEANDPTYTTTATDNDRSISCKVTATNVAGSVSATSNSILVSLVDPNDAGTVLENLPVTVRHLVSSTGSEVTATSSIVFKSDGTFEEFHGAVSIGTGDYLDTTGAGTGDAYIFSYIKLNGEDLVSPTALAEIPLSSNVTMLQTVTSADNVSVGGNYRVTITRVSDGLSESRDIFIGCSIFNLL